MMIIPITPAQARQVEEVQVRIGKAYFTGRVTGKQNHMATVTVKIKVEGSGGVEIYHSETFSWDAIAHHANTGNALRI